MEMGWMHVKTIEILKRRKTTTENKTQKKQKTTKRKILQTPSYFVFFLFLSLSCLDCARSIFVFPILLTVCPFFPKVYNYTIIPLTPASLSPFYRHRGAGLEEAVAEDEDWVLLPFALRATA